MLTEIEKLGSEILKERDCGKITFEVAWRIEEFPLVTTLLDNFVEGFGFERVGTKWEEIDRSEAQTVLQSMLFRDLAYGAEIMTVQRARQFAERFLDLFTEKPRYFTCYYFTAATFDAGVICLDNRHLGILWAEDED